ncbi:MAG: biotin/lipoyl-containing protein [Candidatus Hinthialibacter antarcticus]|nr:biotin/lipoyl-containing protein [Candidatus Hinthialibacter antarcticus]
MATLIEMPELSDAMVTGRVLGWIKSEGDRVEAGEALAEIETDKAAMELESHCSGALLKILAQPGDEVPIGAALAIIGEPGENIDDIVSNLDTVDAQTLPDEPAPLPIVPQAYAPLQATVTSLHISPLAQRIADENGVDLTNVKGSGPDGRIIKRDVEEVIANRPENTWTT